MVEVEKGREFRFRGDLYSQESTFPLVLSAEFWTKFPREIFLFLEIHKFPYKLL